MLHPEVSAFVDRARRALDDGPPVVPLPRLSDAEAPPGTAAVVRTSGSTGTPREVALSAAALRASAAATAERLGSAGRWVLTLPTTHVAGVQVVVRSVLAGTPLVAAPPEAPFTPAGLADLLAEALSGHDPVHVSLVPTQLHRVVQAADDGAPAALRALARCGAVLLGGAAAPAPLVRRAREAGVPVVRTYGMSETSGGCVYDGVPLPGVRVRVDPVTGGQGVVELAGPVLATGYLGDDAATAAAFGDGPDGRWFRTSDLGHLQDGVLQVLGRADDVVVTGGENVAPAAVEAVLAELLDGEVCVVGVPDPEWGQAVVAVVGRPGTPAGTWLPSERLTPARSEVAARLGRPAAPRRILQVPELPRRGPGKVDRAAVVDLVRRHDARR
ncbi:AMP-binding protein [Isoptericola haloaureus]|uniref:AMP-binding protein n=1 Tax=Isoptericola haloaureus TaxID=1542902 RepID=A0ABU7Z900_9MICO